MSQPCGANWLEQPCPACLLLVAYQRDRFGEAPVRVAAGGPKVIKATQHVVVPLRREGNPQPVRVDDPAHRLGLWIYAELPQQIQGGIGRCPGLSR